MSKLVELRKQLGRILFNFEEVTVDGTVYVYVELIVGANVYVYNEDGEKVSAGTVTFEVNDKVVIVVDGVITEINDKVEPEPQEEVVELEEETAEVVEETNELEVRVAELERQVAEILTILNTTVEVVEEFSNQEVGSKIVKKEKITKKENTVAKGAMRYFQE